MVERRLGPKPMVAAFSPPSCDRLPHGRRRSTATKRSRGACRPARRRGAPCLRAPSGTLTTTTETMWVKICRKGRSQHSGAAAAAAAASPSPFPPKSRQLLLPPRPPPAAPLLPPAGARVPLLSHRPPLLSSCRPALEHERCSSPTGETERDDKDKRGERG